MGVEYLSSIQKSCVIVAHDAWGFNPRSLGFVHQVNGKLTMAFILDPRVSYIY